MRLHHRLGAVTAGAAAAATVATLFTGASAAYAADGPVDAGITIHKIDGLSEDFINGVDVSTILSEEESGVVFRDFNGNVADPFDVLAEAGINYVRVRVWNDPYNADGDGYGAGNVDVARATEIGERATAAGLEVLVDFHYSDFWADPGKQKAPKAWDGFTVDQTVTAVGDFTESALQTMEDAGVDVGMVQVGNETNGAVAGVTGLSDMVQVFAAGSAAVRDVYPDALVAVHFTNPETAGRYSTYAAALYAGDLDYDVFASSYYPYWHGSLANLTSVLGDVADTYGKKVMVAETSWANTLADGDGTTNTITAASGADEYPISVQGQGTEIRDVMAAVSAVGSAGIGVFYWEPAWIPVPGATLAERQAKWEQYGSGWATTAAHEYDAGAPTAAAEGSGWDNQALFAFDGTPLESLRAFRYARTGSIAPLEVTGVESPSITFTQGETITLPATVEVTYNDSSTENQAVTWDDVLDWITSPGVYTVHGVTEGGDPATATVTVKAENFLVNGGFETSDATGWTFAASPWPSTFWVYASAGNNALDTYAVNTYDANAYTFSFSQTVTGLAPGTYTATGQAHGENVVPTFFVTTSDGTVNQVPALTGWQQWKKPSFTVTVPADGSVTVGVNGAGAAGGWAWFDDFTLVTAPSEAADSAALEALVDQMNGLARSVYSEGSLAHLDSALEIANIVLAASSPTQDQVDAALELVQDAFDGLEVVGEVPDPTVQHVVVTASEGEEISLPGEVTLTLFDGRQQQTSVTWDDVLSWIDGPGEYTVHGETTDGLAAIATITVTERNWVVNASFEDPDTSMWSVTGVGAAIGASGDSSDGGHSVPFWYGSDYSFAVQQELTGLPAGTYALSATTQGDGEGADDARTLSLSSGGSVESAMFALDGWQAFRTATTPTVTVGESGTATVGASFALTSGAWGTLDDFRLVRVVADADTSDLADLLDEAAGINRKLYTPSTVAALDAAVAGATVLLDADRPSQAKVDAAATALADALDGLDLVDVPFATAPTPTISGVGEVGKKLTASAGTWVPTPSGLSFAWTRNGVVIPGAEALTYVLTKSDAGAAIRAVVTASKADYITESKTSAPLAVAKIFAVTPKPTIGGKPIAGSTLTAVIGSWSPTPSAYAYQWYRNGVKISGATGKTHTVKATDLGKSLTVTVKGSRSGYTSATTTSSAVKVVKKFASTGQPNITGTPKVGKQLTAHRGLWNPSPSSYGFQWFRNGVAISGATSSTYTLTSADRGALLTVKVTAKKSGYLSTTVTATAVKVK